MTSRLTSDGLHALVAHGDAVGDRDRDELARVPAGFADAVLRRAARRSSVMLQGVASFQVLATPTSGLAKSSSVRPMARMKARAARGQDLR